MLHTELNDTLNKLDNCIHCGMCLPACPTYNVTGSEAESPRGRLYLMRAFFENKLDTPKQLSDHLDPCLGCLSCQTVCPSGVNYESLLMHSRQELVQHQPRWKRWIRRKLLQHVLPSRSFLEMSAAILAPLQATGLSGILDWMSHLPGLKPLIFLPHIQPGEPLHAGPRVYGENKYGRVALFLGCVMNAAYHQTQQATLDVLVRNGYQVVIPEQTCCGALAYHAGETDLFEEQTAQNWRWMKDSSIDYIVINAAGCGAAMKEATHFAPEQDIEIASSVTAKVVDIMELLAKRPLEGKLGPVHAKVTYHAACHLHHAQGIQTEPYQVLRQIPHLDLIPLTDAELCCGSAGVYNIAHPELSEKILEEKMTHVLETNASILLAANPGCMMQLEAGLKQHHKRMLVAHPVEIIQMSYFSNTHPEAE